MRIYLRKYAQDGFARRLNEELGARKEFKDVLRKV